MEVYVLNCPHCGEKLGSSLGLKFQFESEARDHPTNTPQWVIDQKYQEAWQTECAELLSCHICPAHQPPKTERLMSAVYASPRGTTIPQRFILLKKPLGKTVGWRVFLKAGQVHFRRLTRLPKKLGRELRFWGADCLHFVWSAGRYGYVCSECGWDIGYTQQFVGALETGCDPLQAIAVVLADTTDERDFVPDQKWFRQELAEQLVRMMQLPTA